MAICTDYAVNLNLDIYLTNSSHLPHGFKSPHAQTVTNLHPKTIDIKH